MATGLERTAISPMTGQPGQPLPQRPSLAQTALSPLMRAYQAYQQYVGQPFQQAVRGGVRGYFGLPLMSDASSVGREAYRQGEALGFTPGVGMPAGAVRVVAEGMQALPSIAGDIGRVISGLPSGAAARQAEDFAAYQRSIPPSDVSPLTAFHGTPHTFPAEPGLPLGRFRSEKIGSGEGEQAYGYGLYFAEAPGVAKGYQQALTFDGFKIKMKDGSTQVAARTTTDGFDPGAFLVKHNGDYEAAINDAKSRLGSAPIVRQLTAWKQNSVETVGFGNKGSLYTVDIPDAMVDKMLDWDKPLGKQSSAVRAAINKTRSMLPSTAADDLGGDFSLLYGKDVTPSQFLNTWEALVGKTGAGEEALRNVGVPGIRYLDRSSRDVGEGTRNIVVFPGEEHNVKILSRE